MSKLRCGVVIITAVLAGTCYAEDTPIKVGDKIPAWDKSNDKIEGSNNHASTTAVEKQLGRIDSNAQIIAGQVDNNTKDILDMKKDVQQAKDLSAQAVSIAGNALDTINTVQTNVDSIQQTVNDVQGTVNGLQKTVTDADTNAKTAVNTANDAVKKVGEIETDIKQYKDDTTKSVKEYQEKTTGDVSKYQAVTTKTVADYQTNTTERVSQFEQTVNSNMNEYQQATNQTVKNIHNEVGEVRESIQGAIHDSATALIQSGDAKRVAEAANATSQRVESGLAQEIVDRKADVNRGVEESKAYTDSRFKDFTNQMGEVKKFAAAGISAALAASQIPQVSQGSAFSLGLGVGSYSGESALAIGISARLGDYTVTKMTVTSDTSNNIGMGGGIAVEW